MSMSIINLSIKEFNALVKYLKRLDDIGDDFFLKSDIISPSVRSKVNRPGRHIVRSCIPTLEEYDETLYGISRLSETSKLLGDIKGKKETLYMEQTDRGIWIVVNDLRVQLAGIYEHDDKDIADEIAPNKFSFDDYINEKDWSEISNDWLNRIKQGDVMTVEDDRKTTYVRIAKDLFKLKGVSRLSAPVDYTAAINILSPESSEDILVVGSNCHGTLSIYMKSPVIECIHYYLFTPFH